VNKRTPQAKQRATAGILSAHPARKNSREPSIMPRNGSH